LRRKLLATDKADEFEYRVSSENSLFGIRPDITIWRKGVPRIFIELKDTAFFKKISIDSDWEKLHKFVYEHSTLTAGFFIYVSRKDNRAFHVLRTKNHRRLVDIPIVLEEQFEALGEDFYSWDEEYKKRVTYGRD
jgi:hypothetical protein